MKSLGSSTIPIIDLFAGPGGLGEGFSSLKDGSGNPVFKIALSIEMDPYAHRTLELRAFYRQFTDEVRPRDYYEYIGAPTTFARASLFDSFPAQAEAAVSEAWRHTLHDDTAEETSGRVRDALDGSDRWVLIGGPPCQAYSLAGRSRRVRDTSFASDDKHTLYRHYLRIIDELHPPVFVMENVKGILSATVGGLSTIDLVLGDLRAAGPGYRTFSFVAGEGGEAQQPSDFVIKAEDYGIPQARHRVIILGIRSDIAAKPGLLNRSTVHVGAASVLADLPRLRSRFSRRSHGHEGTDREWVAFLAEAARAMSVDERTAEVAAEAVEVARERMDSVPEPDHMESPTAHSMWYRRDSRIGLVLNHESRSHMAGDIARYLFCSSYAKAHDRSPRLRDFPPSLLPAHLNVMAGVNDSHFADRFRVQLPGCPATTVTSHISKDGHYFIHYDPSQCRSLSVREAARLQTFPDDYFFEGNRTQQYHQVGNAVPPLLAAQLASVVAPILD